MTEPARFRCFKCSMSFRIQIPGPSAERLRCPECGMRFWSAAKDKSREIKVGINPEELAA